MTRQDQKVGEGATAYQAGGALEVHNHGMTADQMMEIMSAITRQLMSLRDDAFKEIRARFDEFSHRILEEFSKPNAGANPAAFGDPDYQFALKDAHESFARRGDDLLRDDLINLLLERSKHPSGSRRASILNQAIKVAGNLTNQEYAALVISFSFTRVTFAGSGGQNLLKNMAGYLEPFIHDLADVEASLEYLSSVGCVSVSAVGSIDLWSGFCDNYRWLFSKGFSDASLLSIIVSDQAKASTLSSILLRSPELGGKLQFISKNRDELNTKLIESSFDIESIQALLKLYDDALLSDPEIKLQITKFFPDFLRVLEVWATSSIQRTQLTALGKAIAYSCLTSRTNFDAPIEIWVN